MTDTDRHFVILAALQFDETGDRALREACRIAKQNPRAELHIVHVAAPSLATEYHGESTAIAAQLARAPMKLREYVERAYSGSSLNVTAHVRAGIAYEEVLKIAEDLRADMIVLGTHQRTGFEKLVLGSVAERVLREACCPVLVATPKAYPEPKDVVEPPCPDCVAQRHAANNAAAWCERHSRGRGRTHVYTPSDRPPPSILPA